MQALYPVVMVVNLENRCKVRLHIRLRVTHLIDSQGQLNIVKSHTGMFLAGNKRKNTLPQSHN